MYLNIRIYIQEYFPFFLYKEHDILTDTKKARSNLIFWQIVKTINNLEMLLYHWCDNIDIAQYFCEKWKTQSNTEYKNNNTFTLTGIII